MEKEDKIGLGLAYLGVIVFLAIIIFFNWVPTNLDGIFNSQTETIIDVCINGIGGLCP